MKPYIHTIFLLMVFICIGYADALQKPLADINAKVNKSNITRSVEVINVTPTLSSLSLESNATTVNVGETVQLSVVGTYSDNSTKTVDENITYIITPVENAEVNGSVLTALKDGNVTVQAKVGNTLSNTLNLTITWIVDGHTLPPEPDKALNDSTLLGIDTNNNGVRDDVERWIYKKYDKYIPCTDKMVDYTLPNGKIIKGVIETTCEDKAIPYHPIVRAIAMQGARAAQIIIQEPEKARETMHLMDAAQECGFYFGVEAYSESEAVYMGEDFFGKAFDAIQFNTVMRARAYGRYNFALSGGVFDESSSSYQMRNACDFNVDNILGK